MVFLITAFTPFNGEEINPSQKILEQLPKEIQGWKVEKLLLPTTFNKSLDLLYKKIDEIKPDAILCLGQAGGRAGITIERVGINIDDSPIDDNDGNRPVDKKIIEDGENAYFSNLPIKRIVENINKNGIPSWVSNSAGTYVCNHVLYGLLHKIKETPARGGFIHIPFLPEQCINKYQQPTMSLELMIKAIITAIETTINYDSDISISGGAIS